MALNGDLSVRVVVDSSTLPWTPSPSGTVWRKRLHLVGPAESGQVTSIVRYEAKSTFPPHDHPDGEEILVLQGVFSDEYGDWPTGTFLLNPEGFRHRPFSEAGCVIFVKLRQFPGRERRHVVVQTDHLPWQPGRANIAIRPLYEQPGFTDTVRLERWAPGAAPGDVTYANGAELLVLDGAFFDTEGSYAAGTWLRFPPHSRHRPQTTRGCTLYVKEGGLAYLKSG